MFKLISWQAHSTINQNQQSSLFANELEIKAI